MRDFDTAADELQISATHDPYARWVGSHPEQIECRDPSIPFTTKTWREYSTDEPFDAIVLTRSPEYTPPEADQIFDGIRNRFIDEESGQWVLAAS